MPEEAPALSPTLGAPQKARVLVVVAAGVFMATLDASIVNLALPGMAKGFSVDPSAVSPVVSAYLVAVASSLILFGALGDRTGRRRLYLSGLLVFTTGSLLCAGAWSLEALVAFRVVQGLGGAMMFSLGPAILTEAFPPEERGKALGWIASAVAGGQTAGPVVGGLLLGAFGWPSIFLINLPIGAAAFLASSRWIPRAEGPSRFRRADGALHPFDARGAILLPASLLALLALLEVGPAGGGPFPLTLGLAAAFGLALFALVRVERRSAAPLLDLAIFRNREFVAANASAVFSFVSIGAVSFLLPFYLTGVLRFEAYRMGLALLPIPLAIAVIGPLAGRLSDRIGAGLPCAVGLALATLAVATLTNLGAAASDFDLIWRLALFGAGMALFQSPNNSSVMGAVDRPLLGLASGFLSTMRSLGLALGVVAGAAMLSAFYAVQTGGIPLPPGNVAPAALPFVEAQRLTLWIIAGVTAAGVATSLVRGRPKAPRASLRGK